MYLFSIGLGAFQSRHEAIRPTGLSQSPEHQSNELISTIINCYPLFKRLTCLVLVLLLFLNAFILMFSSCRPLGLFFVAWKYIPVNDGMGKREPFHFTCILGLIQFKCTLLCTQGTALVSQVATHLLSPLMNVYSLLSPHCQKHMPPPPRTTAVS